MKKYITIIFLFAFQLSYTQSFKLNWTGDGIAFGSGILSEIIFSSLNSEHKQLTLEEIQKLNKNDLNWLDRTAVDNYSPTLYKTSDILVGISAAVPLALLLDDKLDGERLTYTSMFIQNLLFALVTPSFAKEPIDRYRPLVYNPNISLEEKQSRDPKRSFFSGHTTMAFASTFFFASVYEKLHPDSHYKTLIWTGSIALAGSVGYLRYASGAHFPTDVLVGATVGSLIGYLVPYFHSKDDKFSVEFKNYQNVPFVSLKINF